MKAIKYYTIEWFFGELEQREVLHTNEDFEVVKELFLFFKDSKTYSKGKIKIFVNELSKREVSA